MHPRDPRFIEKVRVILDLYAGFWDGEPLGPQDQVLSADEKTSIQATNGIVGLLERLVEDGCMQPSRPAKNG